jgi:hypothetical protein
MVKQLKGSDHWGAGPQVGLGSDMTCHHGPSLKLGVSGGMAVVAD